MNELLANVFTAMVIDENEKIILSKNGQTFRLSKEEGRAYDRRSSRRVWLSESKTRKSFYNGDPEESHWSLCFLEQSLLPESI